MDGRTHLYAGVTLALAITAPQTPTGFESCVCAAALAATLPDIDTGASKEVYKFSRICVGAAALAACLAMVTGVGNHLLAEITGNIYLLLRVLGLLGFCGICVFGKSRPHREFTHSFLCLAGYLFALYFILLGAGNDVMLSSMLGFCISYLSHLGLDVLNNKNVHYLFPLPGGYCMKICSANGAVAKTIRSVFGLALIAIIARSLISIEMKI